MNDQPTELSWRDGDVYFWRYRDEKGDQSSIYWCCARKAVICRGILRDIYLVYINGHEVSDHGTNGEYWMPIEAENRLILDYKGNLDQFDVIPDYNKHLYSEDDILDLRHANSSQKQIYLRKGAVRSRDRMLERCRYLMDKAQEELRWQQLRIDNYSEIYDKIIAGEPLDGINL
jgi:hypothetical protein